MNNRPLICTAGVVFLVLAAGCMDRQPGAICPVPTELNETEQLMINFEGVDMLLVVDNSGSMAEEQARLATDVFKLVGALTNNPDPGWRFPDASDVRIAVISTDIGLQYGLNGGHASDAAVAVWSRCDTDGDDGEFQTGRSGGTLPLAAGEIPCDPSATVSQCPVPDDSDNAWVCRVDPGGTTGEHFCYPADESDTDSAREYIHCPELDLGKDWAETPGAHSPPNPQFTTQVACMTALGIGGCSYEQQLQAVERGLFHADAQSFLRPAALLAVIILSDEEDCSVKSGQFFETEEFINKNTLKGDIVCQLYGGAFRGGSPLPEDNGEEKANYLFEPRRFAEKWAAHKDGFQSAVVFAAIVGVPPKAEGEERCEGLGNQIGDCLEHQMMQYEFVTSDDPDSPGVPALRPACRNPSAAGVPYKQLDTNASPGRRYVELVQEMGSSGYVYSICNDDWSPAMANIAELIAKNMNGSCYPKPLDWLANEKQPEGATAKIGKAKCHVVVEYSYDGEAPTELCPIPTDAAAQPIVERVELAGGAIQTRVYCALPRFDAPRNCADIDEQELNNKFGWYYCEDDREVAFGRDACDDDVDNDNNDAADCHDTSCTSCPACGGNLCENACRYAVRLTGAAQNSKLIRNRRVAIQCLQRFSLEDKNCQENTDLSCNDRKDNDGNGAWDCNNSLDRFLADEHCCPIDQPDGGYPGGAHCETIGSDNLPIYQATCGTIKDNGDDYPDACYVRARNLDCFLPPLP